MAGALPGMARGRPQARGASAVCVHRATGDGYQMARAMGQMTLRQKLLIILLGVQSSTTKVYSKAGVMFSEKLGGGDGFQPINACKYL